MFTHQFFNIFSRIENAKRFLFTLHKLNLLSEREAQVIGTHLHSIILEEARNLR